MNGTVGVVTTTTLDGRADGVPYRFTIPQGVASLTFKMYNFSSYTLDVLYNEDKPERTVAAMISDSWNMEPFPWNVSTKNYLPPSDSNLWFVLDSYPSNITFEVIAEICPNGTGGKGCAYRILSKIYFSNPKLHMT